MDTILESVWNFPFLHIRTNTFYYLTFNSNLLEGLKWYLIVIFKNISPMTNSVEQLGIFLWIYWLLVYLPWRNICSEYLPIFKIELSVLLTCQSSCFFTFSVVSFEAWTFLNSMKLNISIFPFVTCAFDVRSKNLLSHPRSWNLPFVLFLGVS